MGEVTVEGGSVNFTAYGYNTQHLKNVFVNRSYSFAISPADDLYTFAFDNAEGDSPKSVRFTLTEEWIDILSLAIAFAAALVSALAGMVVINTDFRRRRVEARGRTNPSNRSYCLYPDFIKLLSANHLPCTR